MYSLLILFKISALDKLKSLKKFGTNHLCKLIKVKTYHEFYFSFFKAVDR